MFSYLLYVLKMYYKHNNLFLLYRKQYETLSYATQSENKLPNIQKEYIIDMSSIKKFDDLMVWNNPLGNWN